MIWTCIEDAGNILPRRILKREPEEREKGKDVAKLGWLE
jgi:hypothetical protein